MLEAQIVNKVRRSAAFSGRNPQKPVFRHYRETLPDQRAASDAGGAGRRHQPGAGRLSFHQPAQAQLVPRGQELDFPVGRAMPAIIRERMRCARHRSEALRWRVAALISGNPEAMPAPLRLRLKEASRVQRLTVNRVRRREPAPSDYVPARDLELTKQKLLRWNLALVDGSRGSLYFATLLPNCCIVPLAGKATG